MRPHAFVIGSNESLRRSSGQSNRFCFIAIVRPLLRASPRIALRRYAKASGPALARPHSNPWSPAPAPSPVLHAAMAILSAANTRPRIAPAPTRVRRIRSLSRCNLTPASTIWRSSRPSGHRGVAVTGGSACDLRTPGRPSSVGAQLTSLVSAAHRPDSSSRLSVEDFIKIEEPRKRSARTAMAEHLDLAKALAGSPLAGSPLARCSDRRMELDLDERPPSETRAIPLRS
jgi:hypothetical protein